MLNEVNVVFMYKFPTTVHKHLFPAEQLMQISIEVLRSIQGIETRADTISSRP